MQRWNYQASHYGQTKQVTPETSWGGKPNMQTWYTCKASKRDETISMYGIQQGRKHHGLSSRKNIFHFWGKIQIMATIYNLRDNERIKHPRRKKRSTISTNSSPLLFFFLFSILHFSFSLLLSKCRTLLSLFDSKIANPLFIFLLLFYSTR